MIRNTVLDPNRAGKDASDLEVGIRRQVVGQDEAVEQIARVYQIHRTGLSPEGRPIGNFLFLGPTGSGKTRVGGGYRAGSARQSNGGRQDRLRGISAQLGILDKATLTPSGLTLGDNRKVDFSRTMQRR